METSVQRAQRDVEKLAEPQVEEIVTRSCQSFHLQDVKKGPLDLFLCFIDRPDCTASYVKNVLTHWNNLRVNRRRLKTLKERFFLPVSALARC